MNYFGRNFEAEHYSPDEACIQAKYWNSFTPGQVILDVGALFGLYALPALLQGCYVIAFEPNPSYAKMLERSVAMNNWSYRFNLVERFAWNATEYPKELADHIKGWIGIKGFEIITTTLDIITANLDRVDMIKMDIEGAEAGAMQGAEETLKRFRPRVIIEEHTAFYPYCTTANTRQVCIDVLNKHNYKVEVENCVTRDFIIGTP